MLKVKFWGTRGSVPSTGDDKVYYGGNTSCVEVRVNDQLYIFDCGTGFRPLGNELLKETPVSGKIFISHLHWDHIQGFPFFIPAFLPGNRFELYAPPNSKQNIMQMLHYQMQEPNFPVPLSVMGANLSFHDIQLKDAFHFDEISIHTKRMNHPGGSLSYKLEHENFTFVYATDNEHYEGRMDTRLLEFIKGADVVVYDAQFLPEEYEGGDGVLSKKGWGHSTMIHGAELAQAAEIKQLILFHHDPSHNDETVRRMETEAKKIFPNTVAAFDGMTITKKAPNENMEISVREDVREETTTWLCKDRSLRKLLEISMQISGEDDLENLLKLIVEKSMHVTGSDGASIYLKEKGDGKEYLSFKTAMNQSVEIPHAYHVDINSSSIAGYVALTGNVVHVDNAYEMNASLPYSFNSELDKECGYKTVSMLVSPIKNEHQEVIGVIQMVNRKKDPNKKISVDSDSAEVLAYDTNCEELIKSLSVMAGGAIEKVMMILKMKETMQKAEDAQLMLIQQEKLASLGTMAAGLAHELSQPLGNINLLSGLLIEKMKKSLSPEETEKRLRQIEHECKKMGSLVNHLRTYSSKGSGSVNKGLVNVQEVLETTLQLIRTQLLTNQIDLKLVLEDDLPEIMADSIQLEQVFVNIINNAKDALMDVQESRRSLTISLKGDSSELLASFADTGAGMACETQEKAFTPFFTTKKVGAGTGLGLFVCHGIIEAHKGRIKIESSTEKGTCIVVRLPVP